MKKASPVTEETLEFIVLVSFGYLMPLKSLTVP